ncbi:pectinacetylesterase family protein [Anaeromyxobacter oryzae]|uniref:Esterase n=1 Tax=Anaeromyxobacter oryzae TaxID=2918170 RepID=A0ABN6MVT6_9BACT|nr:pectinacetylesterase family protein [Anaeromyxobacter oryzae]BDG03914.1 hypothetical protein AMOR_29100 [Anaeromyxobacter oryzae]
MARRVVVAAAVLALAALLACGGGGGGGHAGGPGPDLPRNVWTWVDVPGAVCSDGSGTGIAVNRGTDDAEVVVFLDGGGACWDLLTCFTFKTANPGPFARPQFEARIAKAPGTILDRALPGNPYRDATFVFVPYCTGDVHWGDAVQRYPGSPAAYHHAGRTNLAADLDLLEASLPAPAKVVVSGASGGGFGSLLAFDDAKQRWPSARGYLVDDSGPPFVKDDISPAIRAAWFAAWRLDRTLLPLCPECATDLSQLFPTLSRKYPGERLALLSSTQDSVIRAFTLLGPSEFESAILRLATDVVNPLPTARTFLVPGDTHTMVGHPVDFTAGGVPLVEWLRRQVEDDPAWAAEGP